MVVTDKQKKEVNKLITLWRSRLFLHQWEFQAIYPDDESQEVQITMSTEYKDAQIEINKGFWKFDKQKREAVIVHELVHCVVQPLIELICRGSEGLMISQREIDWNKEAVTQHIATAIFYNKL